MSTSKETTVWVIDSSAFAQNNRGPITTQFKPPSSCLETATLNEDGGFLYFGHNVNPYIDPACYPTGTLLAQQLVIGSSWDSYYYSPAICPFGWTTATTFKSSFPGVDGFTFISISSDTTVALCCPSGYIANSFGHQCSSSMTANQVVSYIQPIETSEGEFANRNKLLSSKASGSFINGDGVPIWWQSSDLTLPAFASAMLPTAAPNPTTTDSEETSQGASMPTFTNKSTSSIAKQRGGLATGAKIGIGIGVPLAILAALTISFLLFCWKQRNWIVDGGFVEKDSNTYPTPKFELDAQPVHEIHSDPEPYYSRHELPTAGTGDQTDGAR